MKTAEIQSIKISLCKNKKDNYPEDLELSYSELVKLLTTFEDKKTVKGDGLCLIAGHFAGKRRITANLQQRTLLTLDVDYYNSDLTSLEGVFRSKFKGLRGVGYSTSSHSSNKPRIRIVIPLSEEVSPKEYRDIAGNFIDGLGEFKAFIERNVSIMANNAMYLPIRPSEDYREWFSIIDGDPLDVSKYRGVSSVIDAKCPLLSKIRKVKLTTVEVLQFLDEYDVGKCNYNDWMKVGMALHHQYDGSDEGLNLWLSWSVKDLRYKKENINLECKYKWSTMGDSLNTSIGFASIIKIVQDIRQSKNRELIVNSKKESIFSIEDICRSKWLYTVGEKLTPIFCSENFKILTDHYKIDCRFDVISKKQCVYFNGILQEDIEDAITDIKGLAMKNGLHHSLVHEWVNRFCNSKRINPWSDWVKSKPWDGVDRFQDFCNSVSVEDKYVKLRNVYFHVWLLQLIHISCLNDGQRGKMARSVLVFQGKQKQGKTTWLMNLVPDELSTLVGGGLTLKVDNEMSKLKALKNVISELGELDATFSKSDIVQLKAFITDTHDTLNIKYKKFHGEYRRRTVFFATVNENNFLKDSTGNSRFMVLPVLKCNAFHGINHQQLYAQMLDLALRTPNYELTEEEFQMQTEANKEFESICVLTEKFEEVYDIDNLDEATYVKQTATKVLENIGFQVGNMKHYQNEVAKMLNSYNYTKCSHPRGWFIPPLRKQNHDF